MKEAKQSEVELRSALEKEVNDLRSQLQAVQAKSKTASEFEKAAAKKEFEQLENEIGLAEEVQQNLLEAIAKETKEFAQQSSGKEMSEEGKRKLLDLHGKVSQMNHLLGVTGKLKNFLFRANADLTARVFNRRNSKFKYF